MTEAATSKICPVRGCDCSELSDEGFHNHKQKCFIDALAHPTIEESENTRENSRVDEAEDEWASKDRYEDYGDIRKARVAIETYLSLSSMEISSRDRYQQVSLIGYRNLLATGKFYFDPLRRERYWFDSESKILFKILSDDFKAHLSIRLEISREDPGFKHLVSAIVDRCFKYAERVEPRRYSFFDNEKKVLFYNHKPGRMLVLDGKIIRETDNGNGALFLWDEKWDPVEPVYGKEGLLRADVTSKISLDDSESQVSLDEAETLVECWLLAGLFRNILPERPIFALVGEQGSGKTLEGELCGRVLFGAKFSVLGFEDAKEDGAIAYLVAKTLGVFDNADQPIRWLPDLLARSATGMSIPRRILYTTNDLAEYLVDVFLVITARQTPWARLDVIDRLILLRTKRPSTFFDKQRLFQQVSEDRATIVGELLTRANRAVRRLQEGTILADSPYRLAAFYKFALSTADEKDRPVLKDGFEKIIRVQEALHAEEEESLLTLLSDWLKKLDDEDRNKDETFMEKGDWTRELRVSEIYSRLAAKAKIEGFKFTVKNPLSLGHKLGQLRATFRTSGILFVKDHDSKGNFWRFGLPGEKDAG